MMNKKRHLIIALGILVIFFSLYIFLTSSGNKKSSERDDEGNIAIINRKDIASIEVRPEDKESFIINLDDESEVNRSISIEGYDKSFDFDMALLLKLVDSLENLKAYETIEGKIENYGINDDSSEAILYFKDNTSLTLRFGAETIVPGRVYVELKEHGTIHVIRKDIKDICNSSIYTFRNPQLLPEELKLREGNLFTNLEIEKDNGSRITIRPQTAKEANGNKSDAPSMYVIEEPTFWEASDGKIYSLIISPILSLEEEALVVEDFPEDLSTYGITEDSASIRLKIQDTLCEIIFGSETEDGYLYAINKDMQSVVKVPRTYLAMINLEWYDLMNVSLWMGSIDRVMSFTLETDKKNYEIKLLRNEEGELSGGLVNGLSIEESSVRDIYMKLLDIHIEGKNTNDETIGSPDYKIIIHLLDGTDESMEFVLSEGRNYTILKNGIGIGFYTGITSIRGLVKGLEDLY